MRLKKGFTLAEILIVLMVIGVIATMTIPSMMKGVTEAQLKTGYKKAYNTIANFAAMERVSGALPGRAVDTNIQNLYLALNSSLSVKGYATQTVNAGATIMEGAAAGSDGSYTNCLTAGTTTVGTGNAGCATGTSGAEASVAWIVTEDNLAYSVLIGGGTARCSTKQQIAATASDDAAAAISCAVVVVDVNGLSKAPNMYELQGLAAAALTPGTGLNTLEGDQYKIYVGSDGATPGPRAETVTGRIMADIK